MKAPVTPEQCQAAKRVIVRRVSESLIHPHTWERKEHNKGEPIALH
jgi:hypothetical protein